MAGHHVVARRAQQATVRILHHRYMGQLFPSLLPHVLLLRRHSPPRAFVRPRDVHRRVHSGDCANAERRRPVAFRSEDYAHPLWRGRQPGTLFCSHRAYPADTSRGASRDLCVDGTVVRGKKAARRQSSTAQVMLCRDAKPPLLVSKHGEFGKQLRRICHAITAYLVCKYGEFDMQLRRIGTPVCPM